VSTYLYPVAAILGASQAGLAGTITFLVRGTDGTTRLSARPTGVVEVGTGTGTYSVGDVAFDTAWGNLEILWQVSGALVGYETVDTSSIAAVAGAGTVASEASVANVLKVVQAQQQPR
jgi:hypothetical protein